jgi:hypothetical protein
MSSTRSSHRQSLFALFFGVVRESEAYCKNIQPNLSFSRRPEMLGEAQRDLTRKRSKVRGPDSIRLPSNTLKRKLNSFGSKLRN